MLRELICTTCGSRDYRVRYEARLPAAARLDFAARRSGQRYHPRIVECRRCGQIYSNPYFTDDVITGLYRQAPYTTEPQLENMARDYLQIFEEAVQPLGRKDLRILEVGTADGFFLHRLRQRGYSCIGGIEPGAAAVARADDDIRPLIVNDFLRSDTFPGESFDVVCCFQVMDHLPDPGQFVRTVWRILAPGGRFVAVNHDIRAPITRLLGQRSPMYDIEHVFLFDRRTMTRLLIGAGFAVDVCRRLSNAYTLDYAVKMLPLPAGVKGLADRLLGLFGMGRVSVHVPGGNMATIARRPDDSGT